MAEDLSLFDVANSKLSDAQKLTIEAHELLKEDLERVRQERAAFEEITKTLKEVHFGSSVKLNVGGKIYKTTLSTLLKDPNSMLSAMFSGRHELKQDEEDGAYFIDRDGKLFRYVLNYLRNDELFCPNDKMLRKELLLEARFYQLQGMIVCLRGLDGKSVILMDENLLSIVTSWLPSGSIFSLLFRASADGMSRDDFHRCCDNKGPTLVVAKSETYTFGGFTSKPWASPETVQLKADSDAFLFTLVNPGGNGSVKINLKSGQNGGIRCHRDLGPTFGTSTYYDFQLWSKGNSNLSNLDLGYGFTCPPNVDKKTYFTGKTPLSLDEVEVFEVNF